jgi:hypothetical protein
MILKLMVVVLRLRVTNTRRQRFFLSEAPARIQSVRLTVKGLEPKAAVFTAVVKLINSSC